MRVQLSVIAAENERTRPLLEGEVPVEGVDLIPTTSDPSETFWRQLRFGEFDLAEMSLSSYLIAKSGGADMVAIPVFPSRRFMHTELSYHVDSGIRGPRDLGGKRVGVAEYQQTSALWTRGVLEHDFGVSQYDVHWFMERSEAFSHGGATGFAPPPGISFERIPETETLDTLLLRGAIDAAPAGRGARHRPNLVDRSSGRPAPRGDPTRIRPLFPDRIAEGQRFFEAHGFIPANHFYVLRGDVHRRHPWLALNLFNAFVAAKEVAGRDLERSIPSALIFGAEYLANTRSMFGADPYPYGVRANQAMIDMAVAFSHEQGLTPRRLTYDELFAPTTLLL